MYAGTKVVIVVAMSRVNRALGNQNKLLWHISDDLKRFKDKTSGHPVIMGRKTFETIIAIIGKPLPGRQNIVVTRNKDFVYDEVLVCSSLQDALAQAQALHPSEIHIGGGAEIYTQALPFVDELFVTFVDDEPASDTFFPDFAHHFSATTTHPPRTHQGLSYQWVDFIRKI